MSGSGRAGNGRGNNNSGSNRQRSDNHRTESRRSYRNENFQKNNASESKPQSDSKNFQSQGTQDHKSQNDSQGFQKQKSGRAGNDFNSGERGRREYRSEYRGDNRGEARNDAFGDYQELKNPRGDPRNNSFVDRPKWIPPKFNTEPLPVYDCPWCGRPIRDLSQAIADKNTGLPLHFDCVAAKIAEGENLEKGDAVTYIGGGRFGIVNFKNQAAETDAGKNPA